jgi:hypothetical protein
MLRAADLVYCGGSGEPEFFCPSLDEGPVLVVPVADTVAHPSGQDHGGGRCPGYAAKAGPEPGAPGGVCELADGPAQQDDLWFLDGARRRMNGVVQPGKHKASPIMGGLI